MGLGGNSGYKLSKWPKNEQSEGMTIFFKKKVGERIEGVVIRALGLETNNVHKVRE